MLQVWHAAGTFVHNFAEINFAALAIALGFHVLKLFLRSVAWRNILAAAFPASKVRTRHVFGAYAAGVGVNSIVPARAGDALKLFLMRKRIDDSNYPALASSLVVETLLDFVVASVFLAWAFAEGILPGLNVLPHLPSIDWWWPLRHGKISLYGAMVIVAALVVGAILLSRKVDQLKARLAQGIAILRDPTRYFTGVVTWQLLSWVTRLCTIYFCLRAFHVPATARNVVTVQVADSLATILPFSPGGVGTKQGLLVYMLRGQAPATLLLSLSVGLYLLATISNVIIGAIALLLLQGSLKWRHDVPQEQPAEAGSG